MNLIENNFDLTIQLLYSIWSRKPFAIITTENTKMDSLIEEIFALIPEYRQLIVCGKFPKGLFRKNHHSKFIVNENVSTTLNTLNSLVEEEKGGKHIPLQMIYFDASQKIFKTILTQFERGWFAITTEPFENLRNFFDSSTYQLIRVKKFDAQFLIQTSSNCEFERRLLDKVAHRSDTAASFLIQKKFSEIRYAGNALLQEIEAGHTLYQAELQELLEIDKIHFNKSISLLEAENYVDIRRYVRSVSFQLERALNEILHLEGVIWVCALEHFHIAGLATSNKVQTLPLNLIPRFDSYFQHVNQNLEFGPVKRLQVNLINGHQLLVFRGHSGYAYPDLLYVLLIESGKYIIVLIKQIEKILQNIKTAEVNEKTEL